MNIENTTIATPQAAAPKRAKKAAKRNSLPQPRATVARTVRIGSDRLNGFLKYAFPDRQDLRLNYSLAFAKPFVGARVVAENAKLLRELIDLQAQQTDETLATLAALENKAKEAGKQLAIGSRRRAIEITISTPVANLLLDLVERLDQSILGCDALWIAGVLTDEKRGQLTNSLVERANKVQRAIEEIHRKTQADVQASRAKKLAGTEASAAASLAPIAVTEPATA